jgi:hypothetical protein
VPEAVTFSLTGGNSYTLTFEGLTTSGDHTVFLDSVDLETAAVPAPEVGAGASSFALAALFLGWLMRRRIHRAA